MKQLQILLLFLAINLSGSRLSAQQDSIQTRTKTTDKTDSLSGDKTHKVVGNLFVGVDLYSPALSFFSDRSGGMAFVSYRIYKKWNLVTELGYESNRFDNLDWRVSVNGNYFKLGLNWFISQDYQNASNGFYGGARFAYSTYQQEIEQYPVRLADNQVDEYGSLPKSKVSSYWIEIVGGARVRLISNLYADVSLRPEFYLGSTKQQDIEPLVIPGYGKDRGPVNFGISWGLSWKFF